MSLLIIVTSLSDLATYASFIANKSYISKNLCVNIDKPAKKCNGKCYLSKQLKENKQDEDKKAISHDEKFKISYYIPFRITLDLFNKYSNKSQLHSYYQLPGNNFIKSTFHPPELV